MTAEAGHQITCVMAPPGRRNPRGVNHLTVIRDPAVRP